MSEWNGWQFGIGRYSRFFPGKDKGMGKVAILQVADTGPLESLVLMLSGAGYECRLPDRRLRDTLRGIGCDTVLEIENLVRQWGYEQPIALPVAGEWLMKKADLYVDVKGHRNGPRVVLQWPNLKGKVLWYRINGGEPQHVINDRGDHGDEINPPCPILTPNQWYKLVRKAYTCWPPFAQWENYQQPRTGLDDLRVRGQTHITYESPICLIHNLIGWGYGAMVKGMQDLGVQMRGVGAPNGLLPHNRVAVRLQKTLAMVHLKDSDAPGYAMYEALAAACPLIVPATMIWKNRMGELLIPGKTCLTFHRETHETMTPEEVKQNVLTVGNHLKNLSNPNYNQQIGEAGRQRLKELMWRSDRDSASLQEFMGRHFP